MSDENNNKPLPDFTQVHMASQKKGRGFRLTIEGDGLKMRMDVDIDKWTAPMVAYCMREFAARVELGPMHFTPKAQA